MECYDLIGNCTLPKVLQICKSILKFLVCIHRRYYYRRICIVFYSLIFLETFSNKRLTDTN